MSSDAEEQKERTSSEAQLYICQCNSVKLSERDPRSYEATKAVGKLSQKKISEAPTP